MPRSGDAPARRRSGGEARGGVGERHGPVRDRDADAAGEPRGPGRSAGALDRRGTRQATAEGHHSGHGQLGKAVFRRMASLSATETSDGFAQMTGSSPKRPDWNRGLRSCSEVTTLAHLRATLRMKRDDNPMMPTQGLGDAPSRAAKAKSPGERAKDTDLRCEDGVCAAFTGLVAGLSAGPSTDMWKHGGRSRRDAAGAARGGDGRGDGCGKVPGVRRRPAHLRPPSWPATGHAFSLLKVCGSTTRCWKRIRIGGE